MSAAQSEEQQRAELVQGAPKGSQLGPPPRQSPRPQLRLQQSASRVQPRPLLMQPSAQARRSVSSGAQILEQHSFGLAHELVASRHIVPTDASTQRVTPPAWPARQSSTPAAPPGQHSTPEPQSSPAWAQAPEARQRPAPLAGSKISQAPGPVAASQHSASV